MSAGSFFFFKPGRVYGAVAYVIEGGPLLHKGYLVGHIIVHQPGKIFIQRGRIEHLVLVHEIVDVFESRLVRFTHVKGIAARLQRNPGQVNVHLAALDHAIL
jgi:hypothetical protein